MLEPRGVFARITLEHAIEEHRRHQHPDRKERRAREPSAADNEDVHRHEQRHDH